MRCALGYMQGESWKMNGKEERDMNLIVVTTVEEFGFRHHMETKEALFLFEKYNIIALLRSQYGVLHMMDLEEGADFAESVLQGAAV